MASPFDGIASYARDGFRAAATSRDVGKLSKASIRLNVLAQEQIDKCEAESGAKLACKIGCTNCCHRLVVATLPEVFAVTEHVWSNFSEEDKQGLKQRNAATQASNDDYWGYKEAAVRAPCAFLVEGTCSIYEVRPLSCRMWNSDDPAKCAPNAWETPVSVVEAIKEAEGVGIAVIDTIRQAGIDSGGFELAPAVALLMDSPHTLAGLPPMIPPLDKYKLVSEYQAAEPSRTPLLQGIFSAPGLSEAITEVMEGDTAQGLETINRDAIPAIKAIYNHALPYQSDTEEEISDWLTRWDSCLAAIQDPSLNSQVVFECLQRYNTFKLAYTGRDVKPHLAPFIGALHQHAQRALPHLTEPIVKPRAPGKFRLGFVSYRIKEFNGTRWSLGWLRNLTPDIEKYLINLAQEEDATSSQFRRNADYYFHVPLPVSQAAGFIRSLDLDALIFTDIGMDGHTIQLSLLRLARVQLNAWGHPVTSGSPTIDYYLSSELMEPENGDEHYTEKLVRLPGSGLTLLEESLHPQQATRNELGLPDEFIFMGQMPMKVTPKDDDLFIEIASKSKYPILFVQGPREGTHASLRRRIETPGSNMKLMPTFTKYGYLTAMQYAKVSIDTPSWNGGNTTVQAIRLGTPIVTLPGEFMRGRHSLAFLQLAGAPGMVAKDRDDYVDLVLNEDRQREAYKNVDPGALLNDLRPVRAIEKLLLG